MATRYPDTRILLIGAFDDALHAHAALRRRALERLGCRVATLNLIGTGGWLSRTIFFLLGAAFSLFLILGYRLLWGYDVAPLPSEARPISPPPGDI